jgi:soluble lytic murein transglycosylase-like protein
LVTRAGKTTTIEFEPSFRINIAQNINYGTNFLADANKPALDMDLIWFYELQ